jgi:hypothetical protein
MAISWLREITFAHVLCVVAMGVTLASIAGSIVRYLAHVRQMELDANLKHDMLERGKSTQEIQELLIASSVKPKRWWE